MITQREENNQKFKEHGYCWKKPNGRWILLDPRGEEVSERIALQHIAEGRVPSPLICHWDRPAAILWAQAMLLYDPFYLDLESTGLGTEDQAIEIAMCRGDGNPVFHSLLAYDGLVPIDAIKVHDITDEMLKDAPTFREIWDDLVLCLKDRPVVIYNASYDRRILEQTATKYGLVLPDFVTHDLMKMYALFAGEVKPGAGDCKYQSLDHACKAFDIEPGRHRAMSDAQATGKVLRAMAGWK